MEALLLAFSHVIEYAVYLPYPRFELEAIKEHGTVNSDGTTYSISYGILFDKTQDTRK